jgi:spermidine synthase
LRHRLITVDVFLALLASTVPFILPVLGSLQTGPTTFVLVEWSIVIMVALTGVLGGAAFPLAGRLQLEATGQIAAAAGSVDSADHAGACLGALLCGLLLVPVFGITTAAAILAGTKLASAAMLIVAGQPKPA